MRRILLLLTILFLCSTSFAQNQNISQGYIFDGEPYIAVDPFNSQHIVVAWMSYVYSLKKISIKTKVSFDGGQTWGTATTISHASPLYGSADPSLDFDNSGNVYLSFVDYNADLEQGGVYIVKSTDGGLTWGDPVEVIDVNDDSQKPIDRPWLSIDRSGGANEGNIYITTMPPTVFGYLPPPYHPYLSVSTDGGDSFDWQYLDTTNWLAGSIIVQPMPTNCVSSDGTFHAVYPSYEFSQDTLPRYILATSTDGGNSFSYHTVFRATSGLSDSLVKKGYLILADPFAPEHLVFIYLNKTYGDIDVFMRESFDTGKNWGDEIRINDDSTGNGRIQDLLWGDFDLGGDLVVTWRDRRNGEDSTYRTAYEIWGAFRKKDSSNFYKNFRVSDTIIEYDSILDRSGNDFMCVKLVYDTLYAVWGDTRTGKLNIWFQRMPVYGDTGGVSIKLIHSEEIPLINIITNPVSSTLTIDGNDIKSILIYNTAGKVVAKYENVNVIDVSQLPGGTYIVKIITKEGVVLKKVVKLK